MARDFGVRLLISRDDMSTIFPREPEKIEVQNWTWVFWTDGETLPDVDYGVVYYVHPESEHIFQPQEGDESRGGWVFREKTQAWWKLTAEDWDSDRELVWDARQPYELPIDFRNGKAFFMPESGE